MIFRQQKRRSDRRFDLMHPDLDVFAVFFLGTAAGGDLVVHAPSRFTQRAPAKLPFRKIGLLQRFRKQIFPVNCLKILFKLLIKTPFLQILQKKGREQSRHKPPADKESGIQIRSQPRQKHTAEQGRKERGHQKQPFAL